MILKSYWQATEEPECHCSDLSSFSDSKVVSPRCSFKHWWRVPSLSLQSLLSMQWRCCFLKLPRKQDVLGDLCSSGTRGLTWGTRAKSSTPGSGEAQEKHISCLWFSSARVKTESEKSRTTWECNRLHRRLSAAWRPFQRKSWRSGFEHELQSPHAQGPGIRQHWWRKVL